MAEAMRVQETKDIFALDIGTRSIIGVVGRVEGQRLHVLAIEKENHGRRAMLDGQIENIGLVAQAAQRVVERLQKQTGLRLKRVCLAAAGRALKSESASFTLDFNATRPITEDDIGHLESGAVSEAERAILEQSEQQSDQYYMVGYTVASYRLDGYPMSSIKDHSGRVVEADVVATFLPREVVESLYAVVAKLDLEVASLTLEPIASLNAAIPSDIRLLNLALVDIGAGTSDIAITRDGSVVGYTMATVAGDEITELLMRTLLIDFQTGEQLKMALGTRETVSYTDILGLTRELTDQQLRDLIEPALSTLAQEIVRRVLELNGRVPSAVFLAGGGSKLDGLRERVAQEMNIDPGRVATAGNHFERNAYAEDYKLNDPEYATPLGIAISAGLGLINDSYIITLNGEPAKLFRSGVLVIRDILMMNGYNYGDLIGRTGANLTFNLNGERRFFRGALATPPIILLNGEEAGLSDIIHAGDSIDFTPAHAGADARRSVADLLGADFRGTVTINGALASLSDMILTGDDVWVDEHAAPPAPTPEPTPEPETAPETPPAPAAAKGTPLRITLNGEPMSLPPKPGGEPYYLMNMLEFSGLDFDHLDHPIEMRINGEPGQFSQKLAENDEVVIR